MLKHTKVPIYLTNNVLHLEDIFCFFFFAFLFFFFTRNLTNTLLFLGKTHKITLALSYTVANVTFLLQVCNLTLNRLNMVTIITELGYKI